MSLTDAMLTSRSYAVYCQCSPDLIVHIRHEPKGYHILVPERIDTYVQTMEEALALLEAQGIVCQDWIPE
jgi:hypothetical protein